MSAELLKNKELLQIVLNNIPSFVFWKDTNSVYQGCNSNFALSAGLDSPQSIVGKTDYDLPWSKAESDFFRKIDKEVMASGKAKINFEEPQTISGGPTKWLRTSKIPLTNNDNEIIGILGTYEDITERKEMELELFSNNESLKTLNSKLETVNIELEQFAYATSHDLKEPVRMIGGFVGLIEKKYGEELGEEGLEYLNYIKEGALRMSSLISQILTFSKVEKVDDLFVVTDLTTLMEEVLAGLDLYIKERNAKVEISLPEQKVKCQPERIKMIFQNLILNGIKFNDSKTPHIKINAENRDKEWFFSVSDNGIGIEEEYRDVIFKPFKRLNARSKFQGNGLGLSICKRIVNLHGGEIDFKKNVEKGTVFYFTILK